MSDIVERLRACATDHDIGWALDSRMLREAADEIERLRAENAEYEALVEMRDAQIKRRNAEIERLRADLARARTIILAAGVLIPFDFSSSHISRWHRDAEILINSLSQKDASDD